MRVVVKKTLRILFIPATVPSAGCERSGYLEENSGLKWSEEERETIISNDRYNKV